MNFSEKLKDIRRKEGLSQERLAEKIGVSRQAITKWETGKGLPDIENMMIIAEIFKTTLDELLNDTVKTQPAPKEYVSETIYDIDCEKHFNIHLGSAAQIILSSGQDEKLHVKLLSGTLANVGEIFKIKLSEDKRSLDVTCINKNKISRYEAEDTLMAEISLPAKYSDHCELAASVKSLIIKDLHLRRLEYDGDAELVQIANSSGSLEFTGKTDYDVIVDQVNGRLDFNQWKAKTVIHMDPAKLPRVENKGRRCNIFFVHDGKETEAPAVADPDNLLSITGMFSELVVDLDNKPE